MQDLQERAAQLREAVDGVPVNYLCRQLLAENAEKLEAAAVAGLQRSQRHPYWKDLSSRSARRLIRPMKSAPFRYACMTEGRDPQRLLGHKNASMTELHKDGRDNDWTDVSHG